MTNHKKKVSPAGYTKYILITTLIIICSYVIYTYITENDKIIYKPYDPQEKFKHIKEPQFKMEGNLEFLSKKDSVIKKIDIEAADNDDELEQGLMFRKTMDEGKGMLFIFSEEEVQSFWMKNTLISLDLFFVNSQKEIIKVTKKTTPLSETPVECEIPVLYVVEVNAGFADRYNIKEGDKINFEIK